MSWIEKVRKNLGEFLLGSQGKDEPELTQEAHRLLENLGALFSDGNQGIDEIRLKEAIAEFKSLDGGSKQSDMKIAMAAATIFMKVSLYRKAVIEKVDSIRGMYIVDVILSQMSEDALSPEIGTNKVIEISSDDDKINDALEELNDNFNLDQIIIDITPDLIAYGSYILGLDVNTVGDDIVDNKGKKEKCSIEDAGVIDIKDDINQSVIVPVYKYGEIQTYLTLSDDPGKTGTIVAQKPWKYVSFALGGAKKRIEVANEFADLTNRWDCDPTMNQIPKYLRVGKSVIYPIISKILELDLLEKLVPAANLSALASGNLVSIQVPAAMNPKDALAACKQIESVLNAKTSVNTTTGEVTVEGLIQSSGSYKAIPQFSDGKGTLQNLNQVKEDITASLTNSIDDTRKVILSSIGAPYEIYYGNTSTENKGSLLKRYARYVRKLKAIQTALEEGLRQLAAIHLTNKNIEFDKDDIQIRFLNKLVDIDFIDQLEFKDTTIGLLQNTMSFLQGLAENEMVKQYIQPIEIAKYLDSNLEALGLGDVILIPEDQETAQTVSPNQQEPFTQNIPTDISSSKKKRKVNKALIKEGNKS